MRGFVGMHVPAYFNLKPTFKGWVVHPNHLDENWSAAERLKRPVLQAVQETAGNTAEGTLHLN